MPPSARPIIIRVCACAEETLAGATASFSSTKGGAAVGQFFFVRHRVAEDAEALHRCCIAGDDVHAPAAEIVFEVGAMLPLPLPEEGFDVGDVGAAGDVLDAFVEDREDGRADERLAGFVGDLELDNGMLPGLVGFGRRKQIDVEDALGGRDVDVADFGVDAAVGDGDRFDEEVRHVFGSDVDGTTVLLPVRWRTCGGR